MKTEAQLNSWQIAARNAVMNASKAFLTLLQTAVFAVAWFLFYEKSPGAIEQNTIQGWAMIAVYGALFALLTHIYGGFQIGRIEAAEVIYSLTLAQLFTVVFQYLFVCILKTSILNPLPMLCVLVAGTAANVLWTVMSIYLFRKLFPPRHTYIIYDYNKASDDVSKMQNMKWRFNIKGTICLSQGMSKVLEQIKDAEAVFLCGIHSSDRNTILKHCIEHNIQVYIRPKIGDLLISGSKQLHLQNMPLLHCGRSRTSLSYLAVKRLIDIIISGMALLILSPIMLIVALAIHLYDGGPAFYRQTRLTKDGKQFKIMKFRSMRVDAEKDGVARLASESDSRITPIGHFIRKVRLDELPQLINILKGEMSVVGPRPERPEIAAQYEEEMPEFSLRLQAKGGLTGYAQVYGKYNTKPYDKLQMDLIYIENQSIFQDLKLILVTVKILFMPESTEGIAEGQVTASTTDRNL